MKSRIKKGSHGKKHIHVLYLNLLLILLGGCTTFSPGLGVTTKIDEDNGYVYGSFLQTNDESLGKLRIGIVIENQETTKQYTAQFEELDVDSVKAFAVVPGTYRIIKVVYATLDYISASEDSLADHVVSTPFKVRPNMAHYVGDFFAETFVTQSYGTVTQSWQLKHVKINYAETTHFLQSKYPKLKNMETVQVISLK